MFTTANKSKEIPATKMQLRGGVDSELLRKHAFAYSSDAENGAASLPPKHPKLHLGLFEIGKPLGKGKFRRVYLVRHKSSRYICALKVLNKDEIIRERAEIHERREIEAHSNLRHPAILGFHGWFHDSRRIFLILEYAPGGELYKILQKNRRKNAMHHDMKPENILIGLHGELKPADFSYSVHAPSNRRDTLCGTLDCLPPEMLQSNKSTYTKAVDQWTPGVLAYEFLTGEALFEDTTVMTQRRILKRDMKLLPPSLSPEARDFAHSLLVLDASKQLPLEDVLDHPWIVKNSQPLRKLVA
ncbi:serine/threonine-protein kinase [Xylaria acuta]|nr:serine/threonine-protein kinase [Xylaria acuta]